jgi:hypothetical protein
VVVATSVAADPNAKCSKQPALAAVLKPKFLSNPMV